MKKLVILLMLFVLLLVVWNKFTGNSQTLQNPSSSQNLKVVKEDAIVIDVVKNVGPSVVTIGAIGIPSFQNSPRFDPFGLFTPPQDTTPQNPQEEYIGSGFVLKKEGVIVTNKHVVSDASLKYIVVDSKGNKYTVTNVYRDPLNDIAILKIAGVPPTGLPEIKLGNSSNVQVGQTAIAIGTALGEFRNTVTTGVVSGLSRGITAGSVFEGFVERLDNVIQTDAAINPGNSGGPLLNSSGEVIGMNTAIAQNGQNIGFAIPINTIKESLSNFDQTGQFNRPYLGVAYAVVSQQAALLNDVPQGAYVQQVVAGSAAHKAGIKPGDIITKVDGIKITEENLLATSIAKKKVGNDITVTIYRNGKESDIKVTLLAAPAQ